MDVPAGGLAAGAKWIRTPVPRAVKERCRNVRWLVWGALPCPLHSRWDRDCACCSIGWLSARLRNTRLPDGSPAVKEDIERYLTGHAGSGAHAGYGKRWIETLKAAIEIIPNPLS
jgi:hypothetical protein